MKMTQYFRTTRRRPDRIAIKDEWIAKVCRGAQFRSVQADGRIRLWGRISEAENRFLRVVLLADGETVHNAFFDRSFKP